MPRYFFHLHNDVDAPDEEGTVLPDVAAARDYAIREIRVLAGESLAQGSLNLDHNITISDEHGTEIAVVRFADAISVSGSAGSGVEQDEQDEQDSRGYFQR